MSVDYQAHVEIRDNRNGSWFWIHTHIWRDKRLTKADKVVYGTLSTYTNREQTAFPSIATIALDSNTSERHTYRSIKNLEKLEYLKVERLHGKSNSYTLMKTTPDTMSPLTNVGYGGDKETCGTPDKYGVRTRSILTRSNKQDEEEDVKIPSKKTNPLSLTRGQTISFLKAFPTLTTSKLKEQMKLCNNYLGMSSENVNNPGLFFRKWLTRYMKEHKEMQVQEEIQKKQDSYLANITKEDKQVNLERVKKIKAQMRKKVKRF